MIEQTKFTYSRLGNAFEKQIKTIEDQGEIQVKTLEDLNLKDQSKSIEGIFPNENEPNKIKDELSKIKRYGNKAIRDHLFYDLRKQLFDFRTFKAIKSLGDDIYNKRVNIDEADQEQSDLVDYFLFSQQDQAEVTKRLEKEKGCF